MNRRRIAVATAIAAGIALSQVATTAAFADAPVVTFDEPRSLSIEYGEYWSFVARSTGAVAAMGSTHDVTIQNAPGSFTPDVYAYDTQDWSAMVVVVSAPYEGAPLVPGNYTINVESSNDGGVTAADSDVPATLTITPAALGIDLRMLADAANPTGTIVSARFTGRFVDEYQSSFYPGSAKSPEGTWHITVTDENGEVATEQSVERSAGDDVLATSFYWQDAEPGMEYTATAEFTASGSSANNFSITESQPFSYTGAESVRPVPSSTATGKPDASLPEATGFGLPVWSLIVAGVLGLGLAALVTVLSVRLSRRSAASTTEVAA